MAELDFSCSARSQVCWASRGSPNTRLLTRSWTYSSCMIGRRLFLLLLKADQEEPDVSLKLRDLGPNSMAVEIRAWCEQVFELDISVLQMMALGTLEALGRRAADELAVRYQG